MLSQRFASTNVVFASVSASIGLSEHGAFSTLKLPDRNLASSVTGVLSAHLPHTHRSISFWFEQYFFTVFL